MGNVSTERFDFKLTLFFRLKRQIHEPPTYGGDVKNRCPNQADDEAQGIFESFTRLLSFEGIKTGAKQAGSGDAIAAAVEQGEALPIGVRLAAPSNDFKFGLNSSW